VTERPSEDCHRRYLEKRGLASCHASLAAREPVSMAGGSGTSGR
jgi:hypothetical protein